jgi:hypothetical protein
MIESGAQNQKSFHLAGIIPIAGQPLDFNFPWHDSLMPIGKEYLALERAVAECAMAGCETIWIVCHKETQPLVRERIGEWVYDPVSLKRGPYSSEEEKQIPIFYVPIHPKDRDRRDCLGWSALYGALSAYHISRQLSKWVIPDRYYVAFPYGVYPVEVLREHRKLISSPASFCLTHDGKSVKDGEYLGFTFDGEDFKRCRRAVREQAVAKLDKKGNKLPLEKRYSARHFSLDIVFECVIIEERNTAEVPWYCRVDNWDGYNNYLSSKKTLDKPDRMSYSEWNPIGQDQ